MFKCKPDYETAQKRINAFWNHEETDRPIVSIAYEKPGMKPFPSKTYKSDEERWTDIGYLTESQAYYTENTVFCAEAMPVISPNLGPEILSAWAGCPYSFGETTTWSKPCVFDWDKDGPKAVISENHPLFKLLADYTKLLLERGKESFITGLTDFHPGGDHLAALRDPETFAVDLLENPVYVKAALKTSYSEYFRVYDFFVKMLKEAGMPISAWIPLTSETSMYVPSNDFSCMISSKMFEEFFLEGIAGECRHYDKSIYHLDGPNALRHLDLILSIPWLNAVQWAPGAGNYGVRRWIEVYKKILAAGKSAQIFPVMPDDLPFLMENLPARGVWLCVGGIEDDESAEAIMKKISGWNK